MPVYCGARFGRGPAPTVADVIRRTRGPFSPRVGQLRVAPLYLLLLRAEPTQPLGEKIPVLW
jgi:hypothetical protein